VSEPHVLAIDQGTSSTKCLLVDATGRVISRAAVAVDVDYPSPGWVEQAADQIWASVVQATAACLAGHDARSVAAVGLSTQRESILLWDRVSGKPVGPVIGWQDQRTANEAERLRAAGVGDTVRRLSGLPLDPMFSALKASWLLDRFDPDRSRATRGELCLGTVDSWLVHQLVGGHFIELGNAARTQLLDVRRRAWSAELLDIFGIPSTVLPTILPSGGAVGDVRRIGLSSGVPLTAVMADSHAALFAHGVLTPGTVKATFGTGSSVMGLVDEHCDVGPGLCLTIAWDAGNPVYAVEGNIRASGAVLAWAASILGTTPHGVLEMAHSATNDGVDLVPAFGGLGAPWWDDHAVGLLTGLTLGTGRAQIARAAVEAIALQVVDVATHIGRVVGHVDALFVDGGGSVSDLLMQLQADFAGVPVHRAQATDLSALGAAHLAGLVRGVWDDATLRSLSRTCDVFVPVGTTARAKTRITEWHEAIARARRVPGVMGSG
jgi:glycerol kinase